MRDHPGRRVRVPLDDFPADLTDVACKLIYFVSPDIRSVRRREAGWLELVIEPDGETSAIKADVMAVARRLKAGYRPLPKRTLFTRPVSRLVTRGAEDLTRLLECAGWVHRRDAGNWSFGPELVALVAALDARIRRLALEVGDALEQGYPALMPTNVLRRSGYLTSFPQNTSFVSHLPQRLEALTRFQQANAGAEELVMPAEAAPEIPRECLPPAVCYHRFQDLADRTLEGGSLVTARGTCFRYEARQNMRDLSRLWSFQMRELVYVGDEEYVAECAQRARAALEHFVDELELGCECETAADPFFVNIFSAKRYSQLAAELKYEVRAPIGAGETLAVASLNRHQDFFGRAFSIKLAGGGPIASGCTAFGLERLTLAVIAQHGLERTHWPRALREESLCAHR